LVTRACAAGALKITAPVSERQQATAVVEKGALIIHSLPGTHSEVDCHHTGRHDWREAARAPFATQPNKSPSAGTSHSMPSAYAYPLPEDGSVIASRCVALTSTTIQTARFCCFAISAFGAALVRGFSGFGSALIFVPLASTAIGPQAAAPLLLIIDGVAAAG